MASSSSNRNTHNNPNPLFHMNFDPNINSSTPNTTFVQADPSNFRAVVQRLTGATQDPSVDKLPVTRKPNSGEIGPQRPAFKLHERRQTARKLEIQLNNNNHSSYRHNAVGHMVPSFVVSPSCVSRQMMVSPVSTLEYFLGRGSSPRTPMSPEEEEERAIAEKGFYLHPSPRGTPRGRGGGGVEPPQLLPLFPLQSPRSNIDNENNNCTPS